ncbi:hypothetical protein FGG08_003684 [Glutinoglossum americanum]|uniref:Uncharacterized protein n=1 Tax=Glutinoglossum americanum TaxID=1670608 RepID=A0A9P8ICU8_9PEZI|nr:hypothetical protein FGG08_003684 [Glutinoglossum americanum]
MPPLKPGEKESHPRRQKNHRREYIVDPFIKEPFQIEASALRQLPQTKIKVPKLIDGGPDENEFPFIETELCIHRDTSGEAFLARASKNAGRQMEGSMSILENVPYAKRKHGLVPKVTSRT